MWRGNLKNKPINVATCCPCETVADVVQCCRTVLPSAATHLPENAVPQSALSPSQGNASPDD